MSALSAEERAELRRLATADKSGTWFDMVAYIKATEGPTVLALLDALDVAEAKVAIFEPHNCDGYGDIGIASARACTGCARRDQAIRFIAARQEQS